MKFILALLVTVIISGCTGIIDKQDEVAGLRVQYPNIELAAKITKNSDSWEFIDMCYEITLPKSLSEPKYKEYFEEHLKSSLKGKLPSNLSLPVCSKYIYRDTFKYVNLLTNDPLFSTKSFINCNGSFYTGISSKHCPKTAPEFWEVEIKPKTYAIWLAVIPLLVGNYWADINFNKDEYLDAVEDAKSNIDLNPILQQLSKPIQSEIQSTLLNKQRLISKWKEEEKALRMNEIAMRKEKRRKQELERSLAQKAFEKQEQEKKKRLQDLFNKALSRGKVQGDLICSVDNRYGYIEKIADKKIKVLLKGELPNKYDRHSLFENRYLGIVSTQKNEMIWSDSSQWATCNLDL